MLGVAPAEAPSTLIRHARVFDGTGAPAAIADVLIRGDRIVAVGPRLRRPSAARIVDARDLTLMPGLHDLHTHLRSPAVGAPDDLPKAYAGQLLGGVTTAVDFSVSGEMLPPVRGMIERRQVVAPNLALAVRIGVPGGHGTEYGWGDFFTLEAATPRAARLAMRTALAYRPDVIKVFADGWRYGRAADLNSMDGATLATIVADAHAAGIPVITHTVTLAGAKLAASAGVDAIGHGIGDALVDDALVAMMKANGTAYVPTLAVYEPQGERTFTAAQWAGLRPIERAREVARIAAGPRPASPSVARRWSIMRENVLRLHSAGVRVGLGTDAGVGGVYHGSSALREVTMLTVLGFTPAQALAAATGVSAAIVRGEGGRIAPGRRADLLLVAGRPDARIDDLHALRRVFVGGREVALAPLRRLAEAEGPSPMPARVMAGPIESDAGRGGRTDLDTLPVEGSEGGVDASDLTLVRVGDGRALLLAARLGPALQPFAQLALPLTPGAVTLADARGFTGVAFTARGGGRHAIRLDSHGLLQGAWFRATFDVGEGAREVRISFAAMRSPDPAATLDAARLRAVIFRLEGEPGGRAWLELTNVRFYR